MDAAEFGGLLYTTSGLINQENETIFYFNTTILCYTEMLFLDY